MEYTSLKLFFFFFQSAFNKCFHCVASADMATLELSVQQTGRLATWTHTASRHVSKRGQTVLLDSLPHGCFAQVVYLCISSVHCHAWPQESSKQGLTAQTLEDWAHLVGQLMISKVISFSHRQYRLAGRNVLWIMGGGVRWRNRLNL